MHIVRTPKSIFGTKLHLYNIKNKSVGLTSTLQMYMKYRSSFNTKIKYLRFVLKMTQILNLKSGHARSWSTNFSTMLISITQGRRSSDYGGTKPPYSTKWVKILTPDFIHSDSVTTIADLRGWTKGLPLTEVHQVFLVLITILRLPVLQGLTPKTIFSFQVLTLRFNYTSFAAIGRRHQTQIIQIPVVSVTLNVLFPRT
jgi:hypothetical protein